MVELLSTESGKCLLKLRRRLVKSFLDLLVLMELRNTHLSGYDVMTLVYRRFRILLGSGSVYSLLYRMERDGLIAGTWTERRRIYRLTDKGKAVASATDDFFEDFMDLSVLSGTHQILQHKLAGDPPFFLADALTAGQGCRISAYAAEYFLYVKNCSISSSAYKRIRATISRPLTWDTAFRLNSFVAVSPGLSLSLPVTSAYILYGAGFWIEAYAVPVTLS